MGARSALTTMPPCAPGCSTMSASTGRTSWGTPLARCSRWPWLAAMWSRCVDRPARTGWHGLSRPRAGDCWVGPARGSILPGPVGRQWPLNSSSASCSARTPEVCSTVTSPAPLMRPWQTPSTSSRSSSRRQHGGAWVRQRPGSSISRSSMSSDRGLRAAVRRDRRDGSVDVPAGGSRGAVRSGPSVDGPGADDDGHPAGGVLELTAATRVPGAPQGVARHSGALRHSGPSVHRLRSGSSRRWDAARPAERVAIDPLGRHDHHLRSCACRPSGSQSGGRPAAPPARRAQSQGPSSTTSAPSTLTTSTPSTMMYSSSPGSPWRVSTSPACIAADGRARRVAQEHLGHLPLQRRLDCGDEGRRVLVAPRRMHADRRFGPALQSVMALVASRRPSARRPSGAGRTRRRPAGRRPARRRAT